MNHLKDIDPEVYEIIKKEIGRQNANIELIASENFTSQAVLEAQGSALTNKYAEGYPSRRWYGGCQFIDAVERLAIDRAKSIFGAEHANVQPHSGTQANMAVYFAMLNPGDTILAMDLSCGGHLSHGHPLNFSGKFYKIVTYGVDHDTETLDYEEILKIARQSKPKLILAGACAYPRIIDFSRFRQICDEVRAYLLVDMAHIAGLIASGLHPTPVPQAELITTTTHKTLRGPRAGMILCKRRFAEAIDREVFPGIQGGPLMHVIAAKAVALKEVQTEGFKQYQRQIVKNAQALAKGLQDMNYRIVSGGTDNHLLLVDLTDHNVTGKQAASILEEANITVNKNLIPYDKKPPAVTSGIRLGTPAVTTRGMKEGQMCKIAELIDKALSSSGNPPILKEVQKEVRRLTEEFPLYPELLDK